MNKLEQVTQSLIQTPEGQAAFHDGPATLAGARVLTLALRKGLITPTDLDPKHYRVDAQGTVHMNEGIAPLAKAALIGTAGLAGGLTVAGALGAGGTAAGGASELPTLEWSAATTNIMNGGLAAEGGFATTPALAGGGGASILGSASRVGKQLAPILGSAAGAANKDSQQGALIDLQRERLLNDQYNDRITNQGTRLKQSMNASRITNFQPTQAEWGGPGSGLRGDTVKFSGGFSNPKVYSDVAPEANDVIHQNLVEQLLHGSDQPEVAPVRGSRLGDILGAGAVASSVAGAF